MRRICILGVVFSDMIGMCACMWSHIQFEAKLREGKIQIPKIVVEQMELKDGDIVGITLEKIYVDEETKKKLEI